MANRICMSKNRIEKTEKSGLAIFATSGRHSLTGGGSPVQPERKHLVDTQLAQLENAQDFPFESSLLAEFLYRHESNLRVETTPQTISVDDEDLAICDSFHEYLLSGNTPEQSEITLLSNSGPFTWMHTLGHLLDKEAGLLAGEIQTLFNKFTNTFKQSYSNALNGSLATARRFIHNYGDLIDIRKSLSLVDEETSTASLFLDKDQVLTSLSQAEQKSIARPAFNQILSRWVVSNFRFDVREMFADGVAALMIDAKKAFTIFGDEGKRVLTALYPLVYDFYLEMNFLVTGSRKRKKKFKSRGKSRQRNTRTRRRKKDLKSCPILPGQNCGE